MKLVTSSLLLFDLFGRLHSLPFCLPLHVCPLYDHFESPEDLVEYAEEVDTYVEYLQPDEIPADLVAQVHIRDKVCEEGQEIGGDKQA